MPVSKSGEKGEGENVGESNGERGVKKRKKGKREGKENKREENSRIRVCETCWFISFWVK